MSDLKSLLSGDVQIKGKTMSKKTLAIDICIGVAVLIVALTVLIIAVSPKKNISFGFEKSASSGVPGWDIYDYRAEYDSDSENVSTIKIVEGGSSGKAVRIENTSNNDTRIYKNIKVAKNSTYLVSVKVKTENVEGGAGANISGYKCSEKSTGIMGSTNGWVEHKIYVQTGEKQTKIPLSLGLGGYGGESKGVAYFDELNIKKVSSVPDGAKTIMLLDKDSAETKKDTEVSIWLKLLFVITLVGGIVYCITLSIRSDEKKAALGRELSYEVGRLNKRDAIIMAAMTVICAVFSFWNLGSVNGCPSNYWKAGKAGEYITVSFKEASEVSRIAYYAGIPSSSGQVSVQFLDEATGEFVEAKAAVDITAKSHTDFYVWRFKDVSGITTKTIKVICDTPGIWLNEIGFYRSTGEKSYELIELDRSTIKTSYTETKTSQKPEYLFDEQSDVRSVKSVLNSTYFDEIYHPRTAYEHLNGLSIYEWTHPPLGKSIMSIGIAIFGMNTLGWRFMGTLFGVLLVPLMYAFGKKVFKKSEWAFVTAFIMMFDFMRLSQTRLATIDTYACFFTLAMMYFMYDYFVKKSYEVDNKESMYSLFMCGLMFGFGASSKWTCLYTGAGLAILFFGAKLAEYIDCVKGRAGRLSAKKWFNKNFIYTCGMCVLAFVIIPCIIYVLSYIPYMASKPNQELLDIVIDNQKSMYNYHSGLTSSHSYGSEWYTWPFSGFNIFYYNGDSAVAGDSVSRIMAMGNPFVWWLGIPCLIAGAWLAWKNRDKRMGVFLIAYILQYAPWFLVNRVCFIYHYFTCVPFTMFMIVYVLRELTEKRKLLPKWSVWVYLALVLVAFIMFYPVLTALPISREYLDSLKWFSTWSF